MDAKTQLKTRLPSRHATEGAERAPHRAYYYAMGLTSEQIHQPFVGVATCGNEAAPCNIALMRQAQAVKQGVAGSIPEGAIVKVAGMERLQFCGPARCFDGEEACFEAVKNKKYREGDVLVIRYEGPKGGPGMRGGCQHFEPAERRREWKPRGDEFTSGYLWKYAQQVGSARYGAVTHPGASVEKACYADT